MRQQPVAHYANVRRNYRPSARAGGAIPVVLAATPAAASPDKGAQITQRAAELLTQGSDSIVWAITSGYRAAPALMLGLAMLVAVPAISLVMQIYGILHRRSKLARLAGEYDAAQTEQPAPALSGHAFVELVGPAGEAPLASTGGRFAILNDMLRIGREEDNDIRIAEAAVHRYHAAILREEFGCYRITDLSGGDGNGVRVNGQPCEDVRLRDGDLIELGPGRLRFHAGLA